MLPCEGHNTKESDSREPCSLAPPTVVQDAALIDESACSAATLRPVYTLRPVCTQLWREASLYG